MKHFFYLQAIAFVATTAIYAAGTGDVIVRTTIGNACSTDKECGDGKHCVGERKTNGIVRFAGGYCVQFECSLENPCDPGSKCVEPAGVDATVCLAQCVSNEHCRAGYHCDQGGVCITD